MTVKETPAFGDRTLAFDRSIVVLVEGPDDRAFVARVIETFEDGSRWHVHHMAGNSTDWVGLLGVILASDYFQDEGTAIGLVLDGDLDPAAAADRARGFLRSASLAVPSSHGVIAASSIRTGFFIMPDGGAAGALEELLLRGVDDSRRELATQYIDDVTRMFDPPRHRSKAIVQAYLAGQVEHIKSIPVGIRKSAVLDPGAGEYDAFRQFLQSLAV